MNCKGQAIVETAFMLLMLLLVGFGITEYGRLLYTLNSLNNAARAGARKGAVTPVLSGTWSRSTVSTAVSDALLVDKSGLSVTVTATPNDPPKSGDSITVTATLPFHAAVRLIPVPATLTGRASMRYE